jgi:3-phytase
VRAQAQESDVPESSIVRPHARVETEPVPHDRDAADTPAIWVHPTEPESSLVLGTDKRGGLVVYDMDGRALQIASDDSRPNDVDVIYDFRFGGKRVDLAIAGARAAAGHGVKVWLIDPATRRLTDVTANGIIAVFGGTVPYGSCGYHSGKTDQCYVFVTNKLGQVEQYELEDTGAGTITGEKVRGFSLESICEGAVADPELGYFYVSEERYGIWKFGAEPGDGDRRTLVAHIGEHGLLPDVEGLALYCASGGTGYLIASSQGSDTFKLYAREGDNPYVLTVDPGADSIGDVEHTDGIAVTNRPTSARFPHGLFVAQDGHNEPRQNFKFYAWEDIAGSRLRVDTRRSPRATPALAGLPDPDGDATANAAAAGVRAGTRLAVEEQPLEVESARLARPGSVRLEVGFEREMNAGRSVFNIPFALDFAINHRFALRLEPVVYSRHDHPNGSTVAGVGDLALEASAVAWSETGRLPGVAFGAEVALPGPDETPAGTASAEYALSLILSKRVASADVHANFGYAVVYDPDGLRTRNVFRYGFAIERRLRRFDAVAEVIGRTDPLRHDAAARASGPGLTLGSEVIGDELAGMLGARYHMGDRIVFSMGVGYDSDHSIQVEPGIGILLR